MKRIFGGLFTALIVFICGSAGAATLPKGMISFTFDDGYKNVYSLVAPKFKTYGIPGTMAVITDYVGYDYAVNWQQIMALSEAGWEIANHTTDHSDLATLPIDEAVQKVADARQALLDHGIVNVTSLVTPYGSYTPELLEALKGERMLYSHRCAWWEDTAYNALDNFDPWKIVVVGMDDAGTPMNYTALKPYIDQAISKKVWLVLMFHDVVTTAPGDYKYSATELNKIISYVYQKRSYIDSVTLGKGVSRMLYYKSLLVPASTVTKTVTTTVDSAKKDSAKTGSALPPANIVDGRP